MRKRDLVLKISQDTEVKQVIVKEVVQRTLDEIFQALKAGKRIELRNFGVFQVKKRKKRIGRNPKTGEVVPVPERRTVVFKPGLEMKKHIK
ncbi:MAG: integration host factor subunit beta [Candidatus Omnitrophica bacterium]|nr:integration host factor subunit beta [Candidatus Omnitrophota bacterium]MBU2044737.1 integration host factor subunit beta [Candidatus Omnitrophota bacterium]MBU2250875.1 integration host factor subunit beta [Candidatus Omnitrophota bacterium]MBU2266391.1 integration host factor subunit beta [Candidatus Omnitrophota bacterium]MBU2473880.1 integration host factor subunit beta [Candidatus Omnitrophota bacterium]